MLEDVAINKILLFSMISSGEKNYKWCDYETKPIRIMLPKRSTYVKNYDGKINGWVFLIKYDELLKKYNHVWNKVSNCIQKKTWLRTCLQSITILQTWMHLDSLYIQSSQV